MHVQYICVSTSACDSRAIRALTRWSYMADSSCMPTVVESSFGEADSSISLHAFCPLGHRFTSRARCFLSDLLLWCLYQNNLFPGRLCVMGVLKAMQKKYPGGRVRWMAFISSNPNRIFFFFFLATHFFPSYLHTYIHTMLKILKAIDFLKLYTSP